MLRGFLGKLAAAICRWPWVFVATGVALATAAAVYTTRSLEFKTNRNDLIGRDSQYWRLYSEYAREFSDEEDYVIVVEGDQPTQNKVAVDALVKAECDLQLALICEWLDGAPARMKAQGERGAISLSLMYDAGQLAAAEATARVLRYLGVPPCPSPGET